MDLQLVTALIYGKIVSKLISLKGGGGTAAPGYYALKLEKDLVKKLNRKNNLETILIAGTNGKTTMTYLLETTLTHLGENSAVIGTVNYRIGRNVLPSKNTTPGLVELHELYSRMVEENVNYCLMEVSSHALDQGRTKGISFESAIFTNLTGDHLDYHQTMEKYFDAKSKLFTQLEKTKHAIINVDDSYGLRFKKICPAKIITYGLNNPSDVMASEIKLTAHGSNFQIHSPFGNFSITTSLIGRHNVYNILAAVSVLGTQGFSSDEIKKGIERLQNVPGRLEQILAPAPGLDPAESRGGPRLDPAESRGGQDFSIFVDYAHTEDALKNVLTNLKAVSRGKIILVFGCGGDRDKTKRPKMGKIASQLADVVLITSDNPRSENPQDIISQIIEGCENDRFSVVPDREEAIRKALSMAKSQDVVLIAGKGHETYQIFKDKTIHFDDREIVRKYLKNSTVKVS